MENRWRVFLLLCLYYCVSAVVLIATDANLLTTSAFLFLLPLVPFVRVVPIRGAFLLKVGLFAVVSTIAWEVFAYTNHIWYESTIFAVRVFGLFPIEIFVWNFGYILFILVSYEYFFDNERISSQVKKKYRTWIVLFDLVLLAIPLFYLYALHQFTVHYMYLFLILFTLGILSFGVLVRHTNPVVTIKKGLAQSVLMFPLSVLGETVSVENHQWQFFDTGTYVGKVVMFSHTIPIEEFLFIIVVPFWVVVMYELYLDDAR